MEAPICIHLWSARARRRPHLVERFGPLGVTEKTSIYGDLVLTAAPFLSGQGFARWGERYAGIGLEEDAIADLVAVGGQVMAKGQELVAAAQKLQVKTHRFVSAESCACSSTLSSSFGGGQIFPPPPLTLSRFLSCCCQVLDANASIPLTEGAPVLMCTPPASRPNL